MAPPHRPGQHSTLTVPSSSGRRAWTLTTFHRAGKQATSLSVSPWGKRKISHKNQTLCLPHRWYFNPNIQRMVLPTLYFDLYSVLFFFLVLLFWTVVFMGHSCTRTTVNWEIRSHGWKEETDEPVFNLLIPTSCCRGIMGGWPTNTWIPPLLIFLSCDFFDDHYEKKNLWTILKNGDFKICQENFNSITKCKKQEKCH